jgi:uncharacterized membrane protein
MNLATDIALLLLCMVGFGISLYFTLVYYGRLEPDARFLPRFCSMKKGDCTTVLNFREARLLKVAPNFVFGLAYYLGGIGVACVRMAGTHLPHWGVLTFTAVSWLTVILSLYLAWALIVRLKIPCTLCFTSHVVNSAIALILTLPLLR